MFREGLKNIREVPAGLLLLIILFVQADRLLNKVFLRIKRCRTVTVQPFIVIPFQDPCFDIISPHNIKDLDSPGFGIGLGNRVQFLYPPVQVPGHHVGTGEVDFLVTIAFKVVDPGVFQEAADNRVDFDIVMQFRQVVAQAGNPPHQQLTLTPLAAAS